MYDLWTLWSRVKVGDGLMRSPDVWAGAGGERRATQICVQSVWELMRSVKQRRVRSRSWRECGVCALARSVKSDGQVAERVRVHSTVYP
jgi:hypothetical protein